VIDRRAEVAAFAQDFARLIEAQPDLFDSGDVLIAPSQQKMSILPENQGDLDLDVLRADQPGHDWGVTVLTLLTALADRHGLDIYVRAHADDEGSNPEAISQGELEAFYSVHGFKDVGSWSLRDMIRRPLNPAAADASDAQLLLSRAYRGEQIWWKPPPPAP
jgi:hypothetical protein